VVAAINTGVAPAAILKLQDSDDSKDGNDNDRSVLSSTSENSMVASNVTKASHLKTATPSTTPMVASTKARFTLNCCNAGGYKQSSVVNYVHVSIDADGKLVQICEECGHRKSSKNSSHLDGYCTLYVIDPEFLWKCGLPLGRILNKMM